MKSKLNIEEFLELDKPRQCAVGENWFVPVKDDMFLQLTPEIEIVYGPEFEAGDDWYFATELAAYLLMLRYYVDNNKEFPYLDELLKALDAA